MTREEKKREEEPKRRKKKREKYPRAERRSREEGRDSLGEAIRAAKGRWNDGVMVGWPQKKRRAEKQRRNEAKKKEAEKREETRSKQSKSRILILLVAKLSKITKSLIFPPQYQSTNCGTT